MSDMNSKKVTGLTTKKVTGLSTKKVALKSSDKIKCDVCEKELARGSLKKHKDVQHGKNEEAKKKSDDSVKNYDDNQEDVANVESDENVYKPYGEPEEIDFYDCLEEEVEDGELIKLGNAEYEKCKPLVSTEELDSYLPQDDSLLAEFISVEKVANEKLNMEKQFGDMFRSSFAEDLRRHSLDMQSQKNCNECDSTKAEMFDMRQQYDKMIIKTNNLLKATEGTKTYLRKQLKMSETEVENNKELWSSQVESLSEEIASMKANEKDKRTKNSLIKELDQYKSLLDEKVKENLELKTKLDTTNSLGNCEDETLKEKKNDKQTEIIDKDDKTNKDCEVISIKCSRCRFVAKSNLELKGHVKFVHLTCRICNKFCNNLILMDKHMKENHPRDYKPVCDPCKMLFASGNALEEHVKRKHAKTYVCQVCDKKFDYRAELMTHMKHHHTQRRKGERTDKMVGCIICDFKNDSEEIVIKHLEDVHSLGDSLKDNVENKDVNCPLCDYIDTSEECVIKHIEKVHQLADLGPKKTNKTCRYFLQNRCFKGQDCKFLHEEINQNLNEQEANKNEPKMCKNGLKCIFLKQNRCQFYHKVAAQPFKQNVDRSDTRPSAGHGQQLRGSPNQVKLCRDGSSCDRSRRCKFRHYSPQHYKMDFSLNSSNRNQ